MKPKLRFRLRTLFVLMTIVALVLGGALGSAIRHREQWRSAANLIAALGGKYAVSGSSISERYRENWLARWLGWEQFPGELWAVDLAGTNVRGADLGQLGLCDWIRQLNLANSSVGDADVAQLAGMSNLVALDLTKTKVTDAALTQLSKMRFLSQLGVAGTGVTYQGLESYEQSFGEHRFEDEYVLSQGPFAGVNVVAETLSCDSPPWQAKMYPFRQATQITVEQAKKFNPNDVERLAHLLNVRSFTVVSDSTARFNHFDLLDNWKELRTVAVYGGPFLDGDLKIVAGLPTLRNLAISDWSQLSDGTFDAFGENHTLKRLELLMGKDKTLEVTRHLEGLKSLEYLSLDSWQKTADDQYGRPSAKQENAAIEAIGRLKALPNLQTLWLSGNVITDRVALSLAELPQLKTIVLNRSMGPFALKAETIEALRKSLPNCQVNPQETGSFDPTAD